MRKLFSLLAAMLVAASSLAVDINFMKYGGTGGDETILGYSYSDVMPNITVPTREGCDFMGYFEDIHGQSRKIYYADGTPTTEHFSTSKDPCPLHALWLGHTYTITFDKQGGVGGDDTTPVIYDEDMLKVAVPTKAGYQFDGYYDAGFTTRYYSSKGTSVHLWDVAANTILYAKWTAINPNKQNCYVPLEINPFVFNCNGVGSENDASPSSPKMDNSAGFYTPEFMTKFYTPTTTPGRYSPDMERVFNHALTPEVTIPYSATVGAPETDITFSLAWTGTAAFDGYDCIRINGGETWTIDFRSPESYEQLFLCATAGNLGGASVNLSVTINYTDGTNGSTTFPIYDWFTTDNHNSTGTMFWRHVNGSPNYSAVETSIGPKFYCLPLNDALDPAKQIKSISIHQDPHGSLITAVFALTGKMNSLVPQSPIEVTGLTNTTSTTLSWDKVSLNMDGDPTAVTGYVYDVATDEYFTNLETTGQPLSGTLVGDTYTATIPGDFTTKYIRVRAINTNGASPSRVAELKSAKVLTANQDPLHPADYYTTFFDGTTSYQISETGVTILAAEHNVERSEFILDEIAGDIIPANTAVILKAGAATINIDPYVGDVSSIVVPTNNLLGLDVTTPIASMPTGTYYTLAAEDNVVAFYKFVGASLKANKAFFHLSAGGASAPRRICFGANTTTGMENTEAAIKAEKVLRDGQLYILKNGNIYNVQGVLVK